MELLHTDWNPKQNPEPTYYSCIRPVQPKGTSWVCVKGLFQEYTSGQEEFQITSVPAYVPSLLHKPYLTVSLSNPVKIMSPKSH